MSMKLSLCGWVGGCGRVWLGGWLYNYLTFELFVKKIKTAEKADDVNEIVLADDSGTVVCMYACMHACVYVCMCLLMILVRSTCVHVHIRVWHLDTYVRIRYMRAYPSTYVCVCVRTYVSTYYMRICMCTYVYTYRLGCPSQHTCICMYIYIYVCVTCIHMYRYIYV